MIISAVNAQQLEIMIICVHAAVQTAGGLMKHAAVLHETPELITLRPQPAVRNIVLNHCWQTASDISRTTQAVEMRKLNDCSHQQASTNQKVGGTIPAAQTPLGNTLTPGFSVML